MGRIAFDATILTSQGMFGLNRFAGEVLKEFMTREEQPVVYTTLPEIKGKYGDLVKIFPESLNRYGFKGNLLRLLWHQTILPLDLKFDKISILYSPVPEGMLFPVCRQIITVHDLLPLLFPEVYPRVKFYFRWIVPRLIKASAAVIADSLSTRQDIEKYYNITDKPIHVVYPGYGDDVFFPQTDERIKMAKSKYRLNQFVLCVGETRPYKNVRRLIEAFAKVGVPGLTLAVVGKINRLDKSILGLPSTLGIVDKVKFLDYVPDDDLAALYSGAKAFVFPSLYEGFGIPPLEAMACGCPVVVSNAASLPEVCGDAGYYINPYNTDNIAEGIYKAVTDGNLQRYLTEKGLMQVKQFSYSKAVDKLIDIFNEYR